MKSEDARLMYKVKQLMEGDDLSIILSKIKLEIAKDMLNTAMNENEKRDSLYCLAKGIDLLEKELQSYVNRITQIEEEIN